MSRKGENIYKRKDGRWEGRYLKRIPGEKPHYGYVYAPTYREVRAKLHQAAAAWIQTPPPKDDAPLFGTVALEWEQHIARQVKESTLAKYHCTLKNHLLPSLGEVSLGDMTHQRIEALSQTFLQTLAPRTVSDIMAVLRSVLRFARLGGANIPCDGSSVHIRRQQKQIRVLSRWEQDTLFRYLLDDLTPKNAGILLSLFTGLRVGEVCALRWEDISLKDGSLHVRRTMQRIQNLSPDGSRTRIIVTPPKSDKSIRTIPLPEDLVRILLSVSGCHTGYFLTGQAEEFVEPRTMQYHFARVVQESGIDRANYHALRHTFATRCVELGFDVKSLSELLGHSTITMTMDRYVHPTMDHKRLQLQRLSGIMTAGPTAKRRFRENLLDA